MAQIWTIEALHLVMFDLSLKKLSSKQYKIVTLAVVMPTIYLRLVSSCNWMDHVYNDIVFGKSGWGVTYALFLVFTIVQAKGQNITSTLCC